MRLLLFAPVDNPSQLRSGFMLGDLIVDYSEARAWEQKGGIGFQAEADKLVEMIEAAFSPDNPFRIAQMAFTGKDLEALRAENGKPIAYSLSEVVVYPPVIRPGTIRDFYAFEGHVKTAFANRDRAIPEGWYRLPVFYFSNPNTIYGPDAVVPYPAFTNELDYELEIACVIGRAGKDIPSDKAMDHVLGFMIMNDWSARDIQREEMKVGLGPAKGKDFATSIGPWIVTTDELKEKAVDRPGVYDLMMTARVNGNERSCGNLKDIYFSFGEMIERASQDVYLFPGDVIGSGTVGTGCLLELTAGKGPWLKPGDVVELEVEGLGVLRNIVGEKRGTGGG